MGKVLITTASFARTDDAPLRLLEQYGLECTHLRSEAPLSKGEMKCRIAECVGVIIGTDPCDAEVMAASDQLRVVSRFGVGADNVDQNYCHDHGIQFFRTIGVNADAVADSALSLMMATLRKIVEIDADVRSGKWYEPETFELNHKKLGLLGFGNIGAKVAKRALGFDMEVVAYTPSRRNKELARSMNVRYADTIEDVLRWADIVSLHLPALPETYHLISRDQLAMMKKGSVLINTARGGIVDEQALADALESGRLLGAGLDVFENEPIECGSRLLKLRNVTLSPHCSADTFETTRKVSQAAAQNLLKGLGCDTNPQHSFVVAADLFAPGGVAPSLT